MSDGSTRLSDLLGPERSAKLAREVSDVAAKTDGLAHVGPLLHGAVDLAMKSALDLDVLAFLANAWSTANDIRNLAMTEPADAVAIVKLGKHSITRDMKPVVHVRLGAQTDVPLDVAIILTGTFQGIELSVGAGGIVAVGSGTCDLTMDVKVLGQPVGDSAKLATWKLPGEHRFDPPIKIG